ncbi:MAG: cytochrome P450 [Sphingomonadales bacterium]|nr:cytochrome P450 [Sphingomonadales bacterium]MBK9002801.1 cytochrome P450 [Sphingomonadales bacterium]MBK9268026.1 cytochrome P450 [Sphingomonadales bacterium]MBP6433322.1 cytochrome P450 [Sphingorhabdus sp.]
MDSDLAEPLDLLDPSIPDRFVDGSADTLFARLRHEAPVHYCRESRFGPFWSVSLYEDIVEIEGQPQLFSSDAKHGGISIIDVDPEQATYLESFIMMDPPQHSQKRRTIAPAFTPSEMARLAESIRERTVTCLDALPRDAQFDWVQKVSIDLTIDMLAILLDFPWDERHKLRVWSDAITSLEMMRNRPEERMTKLFEMASRFHELWQQRSQSAPQPDLLSMMVHSPEFGEMGAAEFMGNLATLIVGGNDTTRNSMSGMIDAFGRWPEQWEKLCADPSLIPNAVSEIIRWQCPALHMRRTALEDVEFRGHRIRKGDKLVLWYVSANRQESLFPDGERFMVDRPNARRHLSFGYGIHRCVGARLAELQLQILLGEMVKRKMRVTPTGPVEREPHPFLAIINAIPVKLG